MSRKFNQNYTYNPKKDLSSSEIAKGVLNADTNILSQAITLSESKNKEDRSLVYSALSKLPLNKHKSFKIGVTGSPGVGKSTFIESFGKHLSALGISVAVLTVDPSSNLNGGSILGDKTRMEELSNLPNVFIRPSPSKGELGGVTEQSYESILLCEKAGFDVILFETVCVGQSETHVKHLVDFFLLLVLAGAGDELQGIKRGIMELADAILVTKADGGNLEKAKVSKKAFDLFAELGVMNHIEVESRYEIELEEYTKKIQIEGRVLGDIARNHVIPTAIRYQNNLIENVRGLKEIFGKDFESVSKEQIAIIKQISAHIEGINTKVEEMTEERKKANSLTDAQAMAEAYCAKVKPYFDIIRNHCDKLELLVDNELWTLTKYRELLFTK